MCVAGFAVSPKKKKTAGPVLRGAARSRTLQEGPNLRCGFRGEPRKTAGPTLRGAARSRTLQEGPNVRCGSVRDQTESDVTQHVELFATH